jgi:hypothetical protein
MDVRNGHDQRRRGADADFRYGSIASAWLPSTTSGLPLSTDIVRASEHVSKVPTCDMKEVAN